MKKVDINLSTIESVRQFVNVVSKYNVDIDLSSGRYVVDAKYIMGIFSLDLLRPITMTVHSDDVDALFAELDPYVVK